jgi:hypothetical protein
MLVKSKIKSCLTRAYFALGTASMTGGVLLIMSKPKFTDDFEADVRILAQRKSLDSLAAVYERDAKAA